jgi:hypothetical protein
MRGACWLAYKRARSCSCLNMCHQYTIMSCIINASWMKYILILKLSTLTFVLNFDWMCVVAKLLSAKWCALCHSVVCLPSVLLNNYATWRQPTVKYYPPHSIKCSRGFRSSIRLSKLSKQVCQFCLINYWNGWTHICTPNMCHIDIFQGYWYMSLL